MAVAAIEAGTDKSDADGRFRNGKARCDGCGEVRRLGLGPATRGETGQGTARTGMAVF